jgi:hypothetical protein
LRAINLIPTNVLEQKINLSAKITAEPWSMVAVDLSLELPRYNHKITGEAWENGKN